MFSFFTNRSADFVKVARPGGRGGATDRAEAVVESAVPVAVQVDDLGASDAQDRAAGITRYRVFRVGARPDLTRLDQVRVDGLVIVLDGPPIDASGLRPCWELRGAHRTA